MDKSRGEEDVDTCICIAAHAYPTSPLSPPVIGINVAVPAAPPGPAAPAAVLPPRRAVLLHDDNLVLVI